MFGRFRNKFRLVRMGPSFLGLTQQEFLVGGEHIDRYANILPEPARQTGMCDGIVILECNRQKSFCLSQISDEKICGTGHPIGDNKRRCFRGLGRLFNKSFGSLQSFGKLASYAFADLQSVENGVSHWGFANFVSQRKRMFKG